MRARQVVQRISAGVLLALVAASTGRAGSPPGPAHNAGEVTGLMVPRFVSLRSDDINLRVGPGLRYPITWVLHRRSLPVQVIREFKDWRAIQLPDGAQGWVHRSTLVGQRSLVIRPGPNRTLRLTASRASRPLAYVQAGVVGQIMFCAAEAEWCQVEVARIKGYLRRDAFWGTFPAEAVPG